MIFQATTPNEWSASEATKMSFATRMRDLEEEFAAAAAVDGDVYVL